MTNPKKDNYRTVPAFNYEFDDIADCVASAVLEFSKRPAVVFLILKHNVKTIWLVMPWTQYRSAPSDHPCHASTIVFRGNLFDLRKVAFSFPPDLFGDPIFDNPDRAEACATNLDAKPAADSDQAKSDLHPDADPDRPDPGLKQTGGNNGDGGAPAGPLDA